MLKYIYCLANLDSQRWTRKPSTLNSLKTQRGRTSVLLLEKKRGGTLVLMLEKFNCYLLNAILHLNALKVVE